MATRKQRAGAKQAGKAEGHAQSAGAEKQPLIEWVVGGASAILVAAMIALVLFYALSSGEAVPDLHVTVERVERATGGYRVEFRAANSGESAAAAVVVEGRLERDGEAVEISDVTLDYVPARSEKRGGLYFMNDPAEYRLMLKTRGYADP